MTIDPFRTWSDLWRAGLAGMTEAARLGEMTLASAAVIGHRAHVIADACRDPAGADLPELSRMVAEKNAAFVEAGVDAARDLARLQADLGRQWSAWAQMMTGTPPTAGALAALAARQTAILTAATGAAGKMMRPYHRRAAANAKRLGRRPKPSGR